MKRQAGRSLNAVIPLQSTPVHSLVTTARCSVGRQGLNPALVFFCFRGWAGGGTPAADG